MKIKTSASIYFALLGFSIAAWWAMLFLYPPSRAWFQMGDSESILLAFRMADILLLSVGSLITAGLVFKENKLSIPAVWFITGLISYASFYCLNFAIDTDTGWLGVVMMAPAVIMSGNFAIGLTPAFKDLMFRSSADSKTGWIMLKTFVQIVVVWSLILVIFPQFILMVESKLGIPRFTFQFQGVISALLFLGLSSIGLSGAYAMAKTGRGTPLPLDTASKLVVKGIYGFVRNPMAISGIGQGIVVGLYLGSPLVVVYAIIGGAIWQLIYRKMEEEDLAARFGEDYEEYRRNVKCWIPKLKAWDFKANLD